MGSNRSPLLGNSGSKTRRGVQVVKVRSLSRRWLTYLLLLILDLVICLAMCLGMAKHSRWLLIT